MPIARKEFERSAARLEKEIVDFLNANMDNAYTSDEIMAKTSFHTEFDFEAAPRIAVLIAANFVAFTNDLAAKGKISSKVVNNRMYFTAAKAKRARISEKKG